MSCFKTVHTFTKGGIISKILDKGSAGKWSRQLTGVVLASTFALGVAGCSSDPKVAEGTIGYIGGFLGGVVADEPRAAILGHEILARGGTAADAISAMYFMLSVTMPSRAGLGGGGVCLVFDIKSAKTQVLDFTALAPLKISPNADRPTAIPGNARGFFALQARHGNMMWRQIIGPSEQRARFGFPVSRAFAQDLKATGSALLLDFGAKAMFAGKSGQKIAVEGENIKQFDLAATLGLLRARGVGPFYTGPFARNFVEATNQAGGSLTVEQLRGFLPKWRDTVRVNIGNEVAHFAPPPAAASTVSAMMMAMLEDNGDYDGGDAGERAHLIAETGLRAFADRETWLNADGQVIKNVSTLTSAERIETLVQGMRSDQRTQLSALSTQPKNRQESPSSTGFSAVDSLGNAVTCTVSMNAAFGTGRVASGTGVLLASAPSTNGRGPLGLSPMLVVNENSNEFRLAATASGGVAAPSALIGVAADLLYGEMKLKEALARPRVHLSGNPDVTYVEPGMDTQTLATLAKSGHRTQVTPVIGTVNALYCPDGLPALPQTCQMAPDPRGFGLASGTMR